MDSDNSGSLQSSSGGDEEYESRAAAENSISAFMNIHPTVTVPHAAALLPIPTLFDPISGYPDPTPPSLLNPTMSWPRSDPISAYSAAFMSSPFQVDNNNSGFAAPPPPPPPPPASRNPKKRSRASRRAPTTVLTTDTTNFRAMVQEFTGIPAPPFGSPLSRNRLDLSSLPPSYLRRPFPQKTHSPPSFPPSSSSPLLNEPSLIQLPFPVPQTSNNLYNISNNPVLSSLLQSNAKFPFLHGIKPLEIPSNDHNTCNIKMGISSLDEFGAALGHGNHISSLQNLISSNRNHDRNKPAEGNEHHQDQTGLVNGNYGSFPGNSNINYSDSPAEKGTENVTSRSEGMIEPWICSSE
ncbi:uncharacterized protein [Henckelia pumila]|uniref:uncharacterized protein n=1 Tax=Henckelia pumila TaxID=405737 RepID=UPI003C6EA230